MGNTSEVVIKQNCKGLYFILAHLLQMPKLTRVTEWYSDFLMMFIFKTSRGLLHILKLSLQFVIHLFYQLIYHVAAK